MRGIPERNKQTIAYALYQSKQPKLNDKGQRIGQEIIYSDPVAIRVSISVAKGTSSAELFGTDLDYTKTIITEDMECPIDEQSVLWIDELPQEDGSVPYNYVVVRVGKGIDYISYAVKKVNVS